MRIVALFVLAFGWVVSVPFSSSSETPPVVLVRALTAAERETALLGAKGPDWDRGPHLGVGFPNLRPFQPSGFSAPIVVSNVPGTNDDTPLPPTDRLFIDWAVANLGLSDTFGSYDVALFVDGAEMGRWTVVPPHQSFTFVFVEDFEIGPLRAGIHTFRLVADVDSRIPESDKSDNAFEKRVAVEVAPGSVAGIPAMGPFGLIALFLALAAVGVYRIASPRRPADQPRPPISPRKRKSSGSDPRLRPRG